VNRFLIAAALLAFAAPAWSQATPAQPAEPAQPAQPADPSQAPSPASPTAPAEEMDCKHMDHRDASSVTADERRRLMENCEKADRKAPRENPPQNRSEGKY
jgi:hypothetical protein